jgi:hypothetical protein
VRARCRSQKVRYVTEEQAVNTAQLAPWPLSPYTCPWCKWWHLTSRNATAVKVDRSWKNDLEQWEADRRRAERAAERAARHALVTAEQRQNRLATSRWEDDGGAMWSPPPGRRREVSASARAYGVTA